MGNQRNKFSQSEFGKLAKELEILASRHRLAILSFLKKNGQRSVGSIADKVGISFKAVSKHLLFLAKNGVLNRQYDGPFVVYRISDNPSESVRSVISRLN